MKKSKETKFWIISGHIENWEKALGDGIWGVKTGRLKTFWDKLFKGDILVFYITSPIAGVIGVGKVETKFKQDKPLWPDEIKENKVIYPYRFNFISEYALPSNAWTDKKIPIRDLKVSVQAGLSPINDNKTIREILKRADETWGKTLSNLVTPLSSPPKRPENPHDRAKEMIYEVGKIEKLISEKEYPMGQRRLDVVWRKVKESVPNYVFEVQIGGNIYQALGKLKHAFDIWNSTLFLIVGDDKDIREAEDLLGGTFHEIKDKIKITTVEEIERLHESKTKNRELQDKMGLP